MTTRKRCLAAALALLLSLGLVLALPGAAVAEQASGEPNRFNVVLVIDKSGSLSCEHGTGTDPEGLRFDALRLFLGLLTESGNNVGAVVFDEHIRYEAPIKPMENMEEKKALIHDIEGYFPGYDTDIGSAMLRAGEMLRDMKQENDLPCMILLFSDGMTDFSTGDLPRRFTSSWGNAEKAVVLAQEEGIVINGIHLNVDNTADPGTEEFRLYTHRTARPLKGEDGVELVQFGEFEEVRLAADLAPAFRRLYQIVTNAAYTGAQRVAFTEDGRADIRFTVPSFGVQEVNVIVEGEKLRTEKDGERVTMEVLRPSGERWDVSGHTLDSALYKLVKIPAPDLGIWQVKLMGKPGDWVDVTMVGNPTLSVTLSAEESETYQTNRAYSFRAAVTDPAVETLTEEQLRQLDAVLVREELATGAITEYPAAGREGSSFLFSGISLPRAGEYALRAEVGLGDFKIPSNTAFLTAESAPLTAEVSEVSDMLTFGQFADGVWELPLDELFGVGRDSGLTYTLSDDFGGVLELEDGVLFASPVDAEPLAFTLTATDLSDQSAQIAFNLTAPAVTAKTGYISNFLELGSYHDELWEMEADELFDDPKDGSLAYSLTNVRGGDVEVSGGVVRAHLTDGDEPLSFTLVATDTTGQSAKTVFDLTVPSVSAKLEQVTNMKNLGTTEDFRWSLPLDNLFYDPSGAELTYTLSDDYDGAVTLEDGSLVVDLHELREADFTLTAANDYGSEAAIPFSLRLDPPAATVWQLAETIKTGLFQEGIWQRDLSTLFRDPKGTKLSYTLAGDYGGSAAELNGNTLRINMKGLKRLTFTITATDEYGMSAQLPAVIQAKNMTPIYLLLALLGLLVPVAVSVAVIFLLRRR